jgi:hypothetical protein
LGRQPGAKRGDVSPVAQQRGRELRVGGQARGELGVGVQGAGAEQTSARVIDLEPAWRSRTGLANDVSAVTRQPADRRDELCAGFIGD